MITLEVRQQQSWAIFPWVGHSPSPRGGLNESNGLHKLMHVSSWSPGGRTV